MRKDEKAKRYYKQRVDATRGVRRVRRFRYQFRLHFHHKINKSVLFTHTNKHMSTQLRTRVHACTQTRGHMYRNTIGN